MRHGPWSSTPAVVMLALAATGSLAQGRLPTDSELRAAYCIPTLKRELAFIQEMDAKLEGWNRTAPESGPAGHAAIAGYRAELLRKHAERNDALNRLQLYLLPRIPDLQTAPLLAAMKRAESDGEYLTSLVDQCAESCRRSGGDVSACVDRCMPDKDFQARLEACRKPAFLPF